MAYVTDLRSCTGSGLTGLGRRMAGFARRLWRLIETTQQRRAEAILAQYRRDGVIW